MRKNWKLMFVMLGLMAGLFIMQTSLAFAQEQKAAATDTLTGEKIVDKIIDASGGKAAYEKLNSRYSHATMEIMANVKCDIFGYNARPNKMKSMMSSPQIGTIEVGYDGNIFWEKSTIQGARILEGDELADRIREETIFDRVVGWRSLYSKVEYIGNDTVNGAQCYKLIVYPIKGEKQTWFVDKNTNLPVKVSMIMNTQGGPIPSEMIFGDYRKVDGILLPYKQTQSAAGMTIVTITDSVAHNIPIPDGTFTPPADIQDLAKAKAAKEPAKEEKK